MITAVDTNVLIDVLDPDPEFGERSANALRKCIAEGRMIACEIVWAETSASFAEAKAAEAALARLRIDFSPLDRPTSLRVGTAWRSYRRAGGSRERVIADFLVGAHALANADQLLTRDRGFYRRYFKQLRILNPSSN